MPTACKYIPTAYADYVSHKPSQLKYGVRWICRTKDEDAMGLVLPLLVLEAIPGKGVGQCGNSAIEAECGVQYALRDTRSQTGFGYARED